MSNGYILARFSHGNEPIFIAMNLAAHLMREDPDLDLVLAAPESRAGLVREIADGKGIPRQRVYMDTVAAGLASAYGVMWGGGLTYAKWIANNAEHFENVREDLGKHYKRFWAKNLGGEEKELRASGARMVLSAGDLYDQLGLDAPAVYAFPLRHSEILKRSGMAGVAEFSRFLLEQEKRRSVNFIPKIHSISYAAGYQPLGNEMPTPHMKETPGRADIALPDNSIGMVFSGTGRKIEALKKIAAATKHPIVTGAFSPVEGGRYVKMAPPRAEFVHVYADPGIKAVVGQIGYGMLWNAWNAGKPVIFPMFEEGDDEEFAHNAMTIRKRGLGVEIKAPDQVDAAVEEAQLCIPAIRAMNAELMEEFGTMDGPAYMAKRVRELKLL
ncbi:MAG: hypothetical protein HY516_05410 [Candidatus Aenigmarchaeota archaeon]|nr:hypothetical protein [Candidatus Aenigmarchaeota archaeon]